MIESKDVPRLFTADYVWGGTVVPKPVNSSLYGKWSIVLDTQDGDQWLGNQRQKVYSFGSIDVAAKWLHETFGCTEIVVDLDYGH